MENGNGITALVPAERREVAAPPSRRSQAPLFFTEEQQKIIRDSFIAGASPSEATMLIQVASVRRLDPFKRQIHFVERWTNVKDQDGNEKKKKIWSFQTSIDGFRALAEETGLYDGQDEPEFEYDKDVLVLARVRVYRKDISRPFVGIARYDEFVQTNRDGKPNSMWAKMPFNQLAKCAEAQAFRKAFPEELGGIYAPEENLEVDDKGRPIIDAQLAPITPDRPAEPLRPAEPSREAASAPVAPQQDRVARIAEWRKAIDAATSLEQLHQIRAAIKSPESEGGLGGRIPRDLANAWLAQEKVLAAASQEPNWKEQLATCQTAGDFDALWERLAAAYGKDIPPDLVTDVTKREDEIGVRGGAHL